MPYHRYRRYYARASGLPANLACSNASHQFCVFLSLPILAAARRLFRCLFSPRLVTHCAPTTPFPETTAPTGRSHDACSVGMRYLRAASASIFSASRIARTFCDSSMTVSRPVERASSCSLRRAVTSGSRNDGCAASPSNAWGKDHTNSVLLLLCVALNGVCVFAPELSVGEDERLCCRRSFSVRIRERSDTSRIFPCDVMACLSTSP